MTDRTTLPDAARQSAATTGNAVAAPLRINSQDLFQQRREVEIDHEGRIYRLRLTQLNKLLLTA